MKSLLHLLAVAIGGYAVFAALIYVFQSRMIFQPNLFGVIAGGDPSDIDLDFEDVFLDAEDGVRVHGWFVPANPARGVLLFFHGNAGNITHRLDSIALFHGLGLSVFIVDYRGYGRSEGRPTEQGTYRDARAAWRSGTETSLSARAPAPGSPGIVDGARVGSSGADGHVAPPARDRRRDRGADTEDP